MPEMHDLVAAYALDALDPDEARELEAHLETCTSCQAELSRARESAADIAESVSVEPPLELKERVMEATRPEREVTRPRRAPRTSVGGFVAAAAAAIALVFIGLWAMSDDSEAELVAAVLEAPDATVVDLDTVHGPARFVYSPSLEAGVFNGGQLEPVGPDEVYQLWLIDDAPESAGTFEPGDSEVLVRAVQPGLTLAMTIENQPGVEAPTTDPLFAAEL